jgi:rhodanese-related sulfurtransferase
MIESISMEDFLKLPQDISIIDIRSSQSYNNNHIPGAVNVPYEKLLLYPDTYLSARTRYYIYCQKGVTSRRLVSILNKKGYHATSLQGGYEEWIMKK